MGTSFNNMSSFILKPLLGCLLLILQQEIEKNKLYQIIFCLEKKVCLNLIMHVNLQ